MQKIISSPVQDLSQDLETGCPKLAIVIFFRHPIFQGRLQYAQITTINMYLLIKIRHNILLQYYGNYIEIEKPQFYA